MKPFQFVSRALAVALAAVGVLGQDAVVVKEPITGFSFYATTTTTKGGFTWGYALPPGSMTTAATEYIGYVVAPINGEGSWSGVSHSGSMINSLLLMFWPYGKQVYTSFRYTSGYVEPDQYTGDATLKQIYSNVNSTHYTLVYRCQGCWAWDQDGTAGSFPSNQGYYLMAWANAYSGLDDPSSLNASMSVQHDSQGLVPMLEPSLAVQSSYSQWATKTVGGGGTTTTPTGTSTTTTSSTTTRVTTTTNPGIPAPTDTYDYIIAGAGAAGLVLGDKLSEAGKSVLLIERGPPSSYRWGGRIQPDWLKSTNLTRFDVPGLDNEIWHNSAGIACADIDTMAGCVLGGGTAVNAGLWWKAPDADWDYSWPSGWRSGDVAGAASRLFSRIPGTSMPSVDGKLYGRWGYDLLSKALSAAGWSSVTANSSPNSKNKAYSMSTFMYSNGERGGPMATYLVSASNRKNFKLIMNTDVKRVVRTAGHATGVEVAAYANGGYGGVFKVTPNTGRVILSAGTFGSARILMRSGIGPSDQLAVVAKSADGPSMVNSTAYINLPVGSNLMDHTNTDTEISHPSINFYDYYAAYNSPIAADASLYLSKRSGMLSQSAPNINPVFWETIQCSDGVSRQLQWTARVEGSTNTSMIISQYLGRGASSRGRMTLSANLGTIVSTVPYLRTAGDVEAVTKGIQNLQTNLGKVANLKFISPSPTQAAAAFVSSYPITVNTRRANHWIGSAKIGTDDGRLGGNSVVDTNTRVYGTDNLFVVDASIFPGMMTGNPSAMILTAAEHATTKILGVAAPKLQAKYLQCGGAKWDGSALCASGSTCQWVHDDYYQCL